MERSILISFVGSKSLLACGIKKHDKVSIYSYNRPEWNIGYMATQLINGVAVGVYHTSSSNEVSGLLVILNLE